MQYTEAELEESGLKDFRVFLRQVWDFLHLPPPTNIQNDIARYLQLAYEHRLGDVEVERIIIEAQRGEGKSFITVAFVCWILFLDAQQKIMVVSATETLANDFSTFVQQLIEGMPLLQHLRSIGRKAVIAYDVAPARPDKSPSLKAVGLKGQLTGSRAHVIIADDIEIPKNSASDAMRKGLEESVKEFDAVVKPGGLIAYLGTPQNESSLYPKLSKKGYRLRIWPGEIPLKPEKYHGCLAPIIQDMIEAGVKPHTPTDPKMISRIGLDERLLSYGRAGYALQFLLDTSLSDAERHPLKLRDLIIASCDTDLAHVKTIWGQDKDNLIKDLEAFGLDGDYYCRPTWKSDEMAPYMGRVLAIDPAGGGKDETGYAVVAWLHGMLYLLDIGGYKDGFSEATLDSLAAKSIRYKCNEIVIEKNYGGGMFNQLLKPVVLKHALAAKLEAKKIGENLVVGPLIDEPVWHSGQKELRILDTLTPIVQSHRLVVDRRVIEEDRVLWEDASDEKYSFVYQFTRITRDRGALGHEDRLEALEIACKYFVDRMHVDADRSLVRHQDKALEETLRTFIRNANNPTGSRFTFGVKPKPASSRGGRLS